MGKRSIKENKNLYQVCREDAKLTREKASEQMVYVSSDRIEKVEAGRSAPHPDEILAMAECYKRPELTNYYCTQECPIGQLHVKKVDKKELSVIALEILNSLNALSKEKERIIEIAADGQLSSDEYEDFKAIRSKLEAISSEIASLTLWMDQAVADGRVSKEANKKD